MHAASPSSSTLPFISLPYLDVQPDYAQVLSDVSRSVVRSESYWVSAYKGPDSVHGKVSCERDEDGDLKMKGVEGIALTRTSSADDTPVDIKVACPKLEIPPTLIRGVRQRVTPTSLPSYPTILSSFDVSPTRPLLVLGGDDGSLVVHNLEDLNEKVLVLKGCKGDVTQTKFFPSGEVILTASLSGLIYIHSALRSPSPTPVRTLQSHIRPATSLVILGRGRQVLSGSKDGTVKLWNVGSGEVVDTVNFGAEVLSLAFDGVEGEETGRVWAGLSAGGVRSLSVSEGGLEVAKAKVVVSGGESVTALAVRSSPPLMAVGTSTGFLSLHSLTSDSPARLARVQRTEAPLTSLAFLSLSLVIGSADGMPWVCGQETAGGEWGVESELGGWEESIEQIRVLGDSVWVGGREGVGRH